MLTITEATTKILNAKKQIIKGKILAELYEQILSSALSYQMTEGECTLNFDSRGETALAYESAQELLKDDYDFKRYVENIDSSFSDDYELVLVFDLEKPYKELDKQNKVG